MTYDQAQSPRLGQRTGVENPGVQLVTLETLPEAAYRGQIVYLFDENKFGVYTGDEWELPGAGDAVNVFVGPTEPVADTVGDQWMDTNTYTLKVWTGVAWIPVYNNKGEETKAATLKLATAVSSLVPDGVKTAGIDVDVYYVGVAPPTANNYDLWENTAINEVSMWMGSEWLGLADPNITNAVHEAGLDRFLADQLITIYFSDTEPTGLGPQNIGDGWVNSGVVKSWLGASWVDTQVDGSTGIKPRSILGINIAEQAITAEILADFAVNPLKLIDTRYRIY